MSIILSIVTTEDLSPIITKGFMLFIAALAMGHICRKIADHYKSA